MNKQDLRYSYLSYFAGQYAKKEKLSFDTLEEMAGGNFNLEKEVLKDLINEELIEGIEVFEDERATRIIQHNENLKLTAKGIKEILNLFPDEKKEIINDIRSEINKNNDCKNQKSKKDKSLSIKRDLLILFADIVQGKQYTKSINNKNINRNINLIIKKYYYKAYPKNKEIIEELKKEKLITINYEAIKTLDDLRKIINVNGIVYLQKNYDYKFEIFNQKTKNGFKTLADKIKQTTMPNDLLKQVAGLNIGLSSDDLKKIAGFYENLPKGHINQAAESLNTSNYKNAVKVIDQNIDSINLARKALNNVPNNVINTSNSINEYDKNLNEKLYVFGGILGKNCGDYIKITSANSDNRLPDRITKPTGTHFIVKNGIKVLRGFATASDLYNASEPDTKNYQREIDNVHISEIINFISKMNPYGKYLPELTLVARGGYELYRPELINKLEKTQLGEFENLEYYKIKFTGKKLYRIDGNHRLEALNKLSEQNGTEYYIPFAIILMGNKMEYVNVPENESYEFDFEGRYSYIDENDSKKIIDNEAFLFYFLNAKAKKLTTEENYRGLIDSDWEVHEIEIANKNIILLQQLKERLKLNIMHPYFCNNEPLKQITEILDKIEKDITIDDFNETIRRMNNILAKDKWSTLRENFKFYCQLIFYIAYKHSNEDDCVVILNNLENWVKKYNFDNTTFENPILLYNNAEKTNNLRPINIFVAMAYDKAHIDNFTEWIETAIDNIEKENPQYSGRINLNKIMTHRGYNIDLIDDIMQKIKECSIFIADISTYSKKDEKNKAICDANPNVMYELGIAHNLNKPIILMREETKFPQVPSDIQEKYRNLYNRNNSQEARKILQKAIKAVIEDYNL